MKQLLFFCLIAYCNIPFLSFGQSESEEIEYPDFMMLRAKETYDFLADRKNKSFWEKLKYSSLGQSKDAYISFGGDWRTEGQVFLNEEWEEGNDEEGVIFQRFMFHTDVRFSSRFRVFAQLKSGIAISRNGPNIPLDKDLLDIHQLFTEWEIIPNNTLQVGRMELWYGSRRLISVREGTNVRQSFDGARWIRHGENHQTDFLFYFYNPQRTEIFDNRINRDQKLWGIYHVWNTIPEKLNFDLYYLGIENNAPRFDEGTALETRHSLGIRHWGTMGKLHYNNEVIYQFGEFGESDIRAWTASTDLAYRLSMSERKPTLGLKAEIISGDQEQGDGRLHTFNALYPRGGYFGLLALIGPANLMDIHPSFKIFTPNKKWMLSIDWDMFWRHQQADGIYFPSGRLNVSNNNVADRFIGHQVGGQLSFVVNRFLELETSAFYFITGDYLKAATGGANITQLGFSANAKF